jgi:hypothetical protein
MGRKAATIAHGDSRHEWNAHQRGGFVTLMLWQGAKLSNVDVARLCGMTRRGAAYMMETLSAALPIVFVEGCWQWMSRE